MTSTSTSRPFGAVLTAMVTPMALDGAVDLEAAVRLARHLVDQGNDGLVLNGTTGEAPTTHAPEKAELVAAVVDAVGDRAVVVAGAGSNDTAHAVRMAEQAAQAGAHGLLVVSPYYSRPSQDGVVAHTVAVADATDLPVMLYDVPGRTGLRYAPATLDRLAEHDRIVALKDATGDQWGMSAVTRRTGLAWYAGDDTAFLALLALGGAGIVSVVGHVAARRLADVAAAVDAGDLVRARQVWAATAPALDAVNGAGFQAVAAKAALEALGLLAGRHVRLPLVPADDEYVREIRTLLTAAGLGPLTSDGPGADGGAESLA